MATSKAKGNLKVDVKEDVILEEKLHNWKKWFNGAKRFVSVKPLPPNNDKKG